MKTRPRWFTVTFVLSFALVLSSASMNMTSAQADSKVTVAKNVSCKVKNKVATAKSIKYRCTLVSGKLKWRVYVAPKVTPAPEVAPVVEAALNPTFATPEKTSDGFIISISNFNPDFIYSVVSSIPAGLASIDTATGKITVTNVGPEVESTITVTTTRTGYASGTATSPSVLTNARTPSVPGHVIGALLWSDEFDSTSTSIDSKNWTARYCGESPTNGGSTCMNNEQQSYQPSAVTQSGTGDLLITANRAPSDISPPFPCLHAGGPCTFTSGRLDTQGKKSFKYGYIESRIKVPVGSGNWPAFWMLGDSITSIFWPSSGEIDIMEQWRNLPKRTSAATHYKNTSGGHQYEYGEITDGPDYAEDYHLYAVGWAPNQISFYVDGQLFFRESAAGSASCGGTPANPSRPDCTANSIAWPFNAPFFLILNNAISDQNTVYNPWDGWSTSTMAVDWVRVYQFDGHGEVIYR